MPFVAHAQTGSGPLLALTATETLNAALVGLVRDRTGWDIKTAQISEDLQGIASIASNGDIATIVMEVSLDSLWRCRMSGIEFAQSLRRGHGFSGAFVFLGFQKRQMLASGYSLLDASVAGTSYVRLPASAEDLIAALMEAKTLTRFEMQDVVLRHCGIGEDAFDQIHNLSRLLNAGMRQIGNPAGGLTQDQARLLHEVLTQLRDNLLRCELVIQAKEVTLMIQSVIPFKALNEEGVSHLQKRLTVIEASLKPQSRDAGVSAASDLPPLAPKNYETILVVDDDGCLPACVAYLAARGYGVSVQTDYEEAWLTLSADPSAVLLCDQTFGSDGAAGRRLMAHARTCGWRLIIALSGGSLDRGEVPEAHSICAGPLAKTEEGARRVHEIICEWAAKQPE